MKTSWSCPECHAGKVTTINENMVCLSCGYQEYLYDYGNAFDNNGGYRQLLPDPLPEAPQSKISPVTPVPQYNAVDKVKGDLVHLRNTLNDHIDKTKPKPKAQPSGYKNIK